MIASLRKAFNRHSQRANDEPHEPDFTDNLEQLHSRAMDQHHGQEQSPLFGRLPPEIRNEIFLLAIQGYEDMAKPYQRESYYWRPGYRAPRRQDLALLRTCKRAWLETRPLPLQELSETPLDIFIAQKDRKPPKHQSEAVFQTRRISKFHRAQWRAVETIHVFLQGLTPTNLLKLNQYGFLEPKTIILTTRYTDWLWWEERHALSLDSQMMIGSRLISSVNKVVMEFEMIQSREAELRRLLQDIFANAYRYVWKTVLGKELHIINQKDPWSKVTRWTWDGPTRFEPGQNFAHHPPGDTMMYVVYAVSWELPTS